MKIEDTLEQRASRFDLQLLTGTFLMVHSFKNSSIKFLVAMNFLAFTSCVSTQQNSQSTQQTKNNLKTNSKNRAKNQESKQGAAQAKAQKRINAKMQSSNPRDELAAWTIRMSNVGTNFTARDRQFVISLPSNSPAGSLTESATVIGILRDILTPPGGMANPPNSPLEREQIGTSQSADTSVVPRQMPQQKLGNSLEDRVREKGLDLVNAISVNSMLKNAAVYAWIWNAMQMEGNSELFRQNLESVIKSEANLWQEIAVKVGLQKEETPEAFKPAQNLASQQAVPQPTSEPSSIASPSLPASLPVTPSTASLSIPMTDAEAAKALSLAQDAAAIENFEKAVKEAVKIPNTAANFELAQENLRVWSNRAVTDLRKKAAFEYRTATSYTDPGSKKNGLIKAKAHLEDALNKFTFASNLDTVRDNLKMIEGELSKL